MITIELHNLLLHGFHGIHEEEKKIMNTFEVNLDVSYMEKQAGFEHISDTISYTDLYALVKKRIETPKLLLEKICGEVIQAIKKQYPFVQEVSISIYKLQAPIQNFQGKVGVRMQRKFDDSTKT